MFTKRIISNILHIYKSHSISRRVLKLESILANSRFQTRLYGNNTHNNQLSSGVKGTTFLEVENNFIYQVLNGVPRNNHLSVKGQTINDETSFTSYLNKDWRSSNATDIVSAFKTVKPFCLSRNITFNDLRFDSLVDGLMDHCDKLNDNELYELLKCISEYPVCAAYISHNYHDLWSCLDDMCCWKMHNWDIDKLFMFGDIWFKLRLAKLSDFIFEVLDRQVKKADKLTKDQLLHIFFYFNLCRHRPVDFEYEHALQNKIHEMNVDELAVIALGYFKTKSKIKIDSVKEAMVKEVTSNAMGIHEITLTAIMKALRLSYPTKILPDVKRMLDSLTLELDRFSDIACLHIALLCTGMQTFHEDILRKCSQRLVENLPNIRLKDLERILNVLTMFTFDPKTKPDIFQAIYQELHKESRIGEINQHPRCLVAALNYFSLRKIYSYELMNRVLDHDYIKINFGKQAKMLPHQLFSLDACIDIDCPDYKGNRMPVELKYKAAKWATEWPPSYDQFKKISSRDKLFLDTVDIIKNFLGEECFIIEHVLPHFHMADIIMCKNTKTGTFVKPIGFEMYTLGDVMKPFNDGNLKWYAVVVLIWNNTVKDSGEPLGHTGMKLRQLKEIGYEPITVLWNQFMRLNLEEQKHYILSKLV